VPAWRESRPGRGRRLAGALLVVTGCVLGWQAWTWPDVEALATKNPRTTAFLDQYAERQRKIGKSGRMQWQWVPDELISSNLKRAVVAAEDMEFFSHEGFSTLEIKSAIETSLRELEAPRGASTITQQLAKNLWLSPSRNPLRKLKEAILTLQLEKYLGKRRILELYLNVVEFGPGIYGVEAASRHYFGKAAESVTELEAAMLAAGLPRPLVWHPGAKSRGYQRYVEAIERRMARASFLARHVE
jgi:monofunctional biosynthetic peptidoglycan transglycosylase